MPEKDLYAVLGVARGATEDEIRKAFRKLARRHHPDVNPNDKKAEERFKEISFAYEVLSDSAKRARYDEFGDAALQQGFDPEQARAYTSWSERARRSPFRDSMGDDVEIDLEDLLGGLFRGGRGARGPARGHDAQGEVEVDFLDAVLAREVRVEPQGRAALRVKIPPGSDSGTRIRLGGQGAAGASGGAAGDLYLTLRVRPHPHFTREGADLRLELPVTLPELVLGGSVEVPTPDGVITMKIPLRSQNGRVLRVRGKGALVREGERGDLYVRLVAALPEGDDARLEAIAKELEPLYAGVDPRAKLREGAK